VIIFYFKNAVLYYAFGILFASHVSGCVGDLYMTYLLLTKYKSKELLVRDTGPEQILYLKQNKNRRS
ncbi:MAG: hypothetical protein KBS59_05870, partial [Clostridiales bacterium]|nr:hypothetical protein [Clostridiales bacterium]